jgi:hypothetical protein
LDGIHNNASILAYYKLIGEDGTKYKNPIVTNNKIELMLPIPDDIISDNNIDIYVNDQKAIIDSIIYEAGVGSVFGFNVENKYTDDEEEKLIVIITWSLNKTYVIKSCITILSIFVVLFLTYLFIINM